MFRIICIAIGYLFGCFQTAYLITRHKISQDIRDFGTGNMGTANVTQTLGPKAGLITLLADVLKTFVACYLCGLIFPASRMSWLSFMRARASLWGMISPSG